MKHMPAEGIDPEPLFSKFALKNLNLFLSQTDKNYFCYEINIYFLGVFLSLL